MSKFNSVLPNLGKISQLLFPALPAPIFVAQVGEANPKTDKVDSAVSSSEIKDKANSEFQRTFVIQSKKGSAIELYYFDGKENKKIQLPIRDNLSFYDKDLGQIERKTTSVGGETVYTYTFNVSKAYGTKGEGLGLKLEQKEYLLSVKASGESAIKAQALDLTKPLLTNSKIELSSFLNVDLNPRGQRNTFPEYPNVTFDAPRYSPKGLFKLAGELVSVGTAEHETVHAVNGFIYNNAESLFGVHANVVKNGKFSFSGIEAVYLGEGKATFVKVPGFYMEKSAT
ncbi:MAG: hypothetical protein KBC84_05880, partial [Proteobacteria bacterium]|nr:hypothetical protein [Pseudomonadota bacterium]